MFPAIKDAFREFRDGLPGELTTLGLDLKGFSFNTATRSEELRKLYSTYPSIARAVGFSTPAYSGKSINESTALNIATVWRCVQVIAQAQSWLPLHVMQHADTGDRVASEHPLDWVLYRKPNPEMSSIRMRHTMMQHLLLWGNAYARRVKRGGTGQTIGLYVITPDRVRPERNKSGERVYVVREGNEQEKTYPKDEIFHLANMSFDGQMGYSVVSMARHTFGLAAVQEEFASRFFARGGRRPFAIRKARFRTDEERAQARGALEEEYEGSDNFHKTMILEGETEIQELGLPLDDLQLLDSRKFSVSEICRWFGVQPHLAFDLDRSTNNNIEHQGREFVTQTLMWWLCLWEQEAESQLLTEGEQGRYYIKHNVNALQRAEFESRMRGYSTGLQNGFLCPDDVRKHEDMPPLPNGAGKAFHIQQNMQTLTPEGQPLASEMGAARTEQTGGDDGNQAD
jgi:HK97 family phage portal protein